MSELLHPADPARAARAQLTAFARAFEARLGRTLPDWPALHRASVDEAEAFWGALLAWAGVLCEGEAEPVRVGEGVETARFFPGLRLSWAENLLAPRPGAGEAIAVVAVDEAGARTAISRRALRARVQAAAAALRARGLTAGDRVVALARNDLEAIVACLAATSLGASWSSVSPDMGLDAALSRFGQLGPTVLFAHPATQLAGARLVPRLAELCARLPSLRLAVGLAGALDGLPVAATTLAALEEEGAGHEEPFARFPFDHPLFIMFSSGTTGAPKCIVHGHGGTLLEHVKELRLHCDLGPADRLLFQTSTGWMMWNWLVSALACGTRVVVYDGSVSHPTPDALLQVLAREEVTVFGTSPAYLQYLADAGITRPPGSLPAIRELHSTGSVLYAHLHRWAKEHLAGAPLQSISGGTDIIGCFVQGNPWAAVRAGESACVGLGLDVRVAGPEGLAREGRGELVCASPFPSRPVTLHGPDGGRRYHEAYFSQREGVWTHGDLVELLPGGAARILGRCDGVLNIRGIRIGPGEIYEVLAAAVPEVATAMACDQEAPGEAGGKRLVLLVVLKPGVTLDRPLTLRIKRELKTRASSAHVPAVILQVDELPTTFNGKRSEAALQDALNGRPVRNRAALRNPGCLDALLARPELKVGV